MHRLPKIVFPSFLLALAACGGAGLPREAVEHNARGAELLAEGALDDAEARFHIALEYHPRFSEPRANLGIVAMERGDLALAERHLRAAVELNEDFAQAWGNLGVVLERQGRLSEAREAYDRALSIDPGVPSPRRNLAFLHARVGRFDEARAQLQRLVQITPDDVEAAGLLAYCELRLDRRRAARDRASAILDAHPEAPLALAVRGVLRAFDGDLDGAVADLSIASDDPVVGDHAKKRLAAVHVLRGDCTEARELVDALLASDPEDPAVLLIDRTARTSCR